MSWDKSKYYLDEQPESLSRSIDIATNAIDLIPYGIPTSVPIDIYISTDDDSVNSSYPVNSSDFFVIEIPYSSFDKYNLPAEYFKMHRITSKSSDTNTVSTTEEFHNADTIKAQLDTGSKVS